MTAIRIVRVSDNGISDLLDTELKIQKGSQLFFVASSPEGLSWFALVSTSAPGSPSAIGQDGEIWNPFVSFAVYVEEKGIYLALIILISAGIAAILLYLKKLNA
jgi:hypothetical protein